MINKFNVGSTVVKDTVIDTSTINVILIIEAYGESLKVTVIDAHLIVADLQLSTWIGSPSRFFQV